MIPTEIITFTVSTAIPLRQGFGAQVGAWIKLKSKQMEVQKHQSDLWAKQAGVVLEDRQKARDFIPLGGPLTRRIIVLAVLFTVFIAPFILAAFFPHTPVFYAYAEKTRGFWFIFESIVGSLGIFSGKGIRDFHFMHSRFPVLFKHFSWLF